MNTSTCDCIYLRKSRTDIGTCQPNEKETLARHESQLLELAKHLDCHVTAIYREVVSGETILTRPVVQQLLNEVENGQWRSVLVMDLDRLARGNTADQGRIMECFQYSGTCIITPQKIYDPQNEYDEEYMEFGLFLSRREYRLINRRIQRGRQQSAKEGKYIGNKPPYGYQREKLKSEKGWTLLPHPQEAAIVKEIFSSYHGVSICSIPNQAPVPGSSCPRLRVPDIAESLNKRNIPTATGKSWTPSAIYSILKNPVYAGYIKHGARPQIRHKTLYAVEIHRPHVPDCPLYPGRHPAIVPKEFFLSSVKNRNRRVGSS